MLPMQGTMAETARSATAGKILGSSIQVAERVADFAGPPIVPGKTCLAAGPWGKLNVTIDRLARRAAALPTSFPAPHFPSELGEGVIPFDSGFAAPQLLPDLVPFAIQALTTHREQSLQYSPTHGEPELRGWLAGLMNQDGCDLDADNILIVNGAKHGIELICRLLLDEGD